MNDELCSLRRTPLNVQQGTGERRTRNKERPTSNDVHRFALVSNSGNHAILSALNAKLQEFSGVFRNFQEFLERLQGKNSCNS